MRPLKAIEDSPIKQWSHEWPEFNELHYDSAYQRGYKAGWKDAYEKAFNAGLEAGLTQKGKGKQTLSAISERAAAANSAEKVTPSKMPQHQKELAQILFNCRIRSQKELIKHDNIPEEFAETAQTEKQHKEHELRLMDEAELKKLCHELSVSAEGNKTVMIERLMEKMYPA